MVKKLQKMSADSKKKSVFSGDGNAPLAQAVKDSAQQIWLAGLGAFAKAQEEGGKVFESLVKDGLSIQRKTQSAAEDKISEASSKMVSMASGIQSKAGHQWDKLETIFEERVGKALAKLGVPNQRDIDALNARIDALPGATKARTTASTNASAPAKKSRRSPVRKAASPAAAPASASATTAPAAKKSAAAPRRAAAKRSSTAAKTAAPAAKSADSSASNAS